MSDRAGRWSRRQWLLASGASGIALSGCTDPIDNTDPAVTSTPAEVTGTVKQTPSDDVSHTAPPPTENFHPPDTDPTSVTLERTELARNLAIPWDLAFRPNDILYTERVGRVGRYDGESAETLFEIPDAIDAGAIEPGSDESAWWGANGRGEGGTMGIAVHPTNQDLIYVHYTAATAYGEENRVEAFDISADHPEETGQVIVDAIPLGRDAAPIHRGGRLEIGPQNYLWIATGDGGIGYPDAEDDTKGMPAQDSSLLAGKILRVTLNGKPAPGNPTGDGWDPRIYTLGHRNPEGLAWLPDHTPMVIEHGPNSGYEEVSFLEKGNNYGWPVARKGVEYAERDDIVPPVLSSTRGRGSAGGVQQAVWAPSGGTFYTGDAIPAWKNRLILGCLFAKMLAVVSFYPAGEAPDPGPNGRRFEMPWLDDRYTATAHTLLHEEIGRIRHCAQGPDGALYVLTSNRDGRGTTDTFPRKSDDVLLKLEAKQ